MPKVLVVTPVLNNVFYTKQFLRSLERQKFKDFAVCIVDNGSTDETASFLAEYSKKTVPFEMIVVSNKENHGYAGGVNDGLREAKYTFNGEVDVLVTNNDMELLPDCIEELIQAKQSLILNSSATVGILGGRLLFPDGKIQHGGALIGVYGWGIHKLAGAVDSEMFHEEIAEQEYVTGALFYITKELLEVLPQFDEQFNPAYFEEVDYCTEARKLGYRTYYVPTVKAIHYESKTANQVLGNLQEVNQLSYRNQIKFYMKHDYGVADYKPTSDKQALIVGKIYGDWSFSIVLRNLAKGLKRNGVDVAVAPEEYHQPMNIDDWEIKEMILKPKDYWNRVALRSAEGDHQYLLPPAKKRVAHTTFEGTRPHKGWIDQLNHVDQVVTNSSFCRERLISSGVTTPIGIVPNPVDVSLFNPSAVPMTMEGRRKFGFLAMSAYGARKNLEGLIRAFILEFKQDEDVFLSVHALSLFYILQQMNHLDIRSWVVNGIMNGQDLPHAPIYITSNSMHPRMVPSIYRAHNCFLMPSKCEGFGNGIIEAAACGIPSIATNYSGMTDFLSEDVGYPLEYSIEPMPLQVLPYFRNYIGSDWANPSIDHMRQLMRHAYAHPDEVKQKGQAAFQKAQEYDIIPVGKKLSDIMFY